MSTCSDDPSLFDHGSNATVLLFMRLQEFKSSYTEIHRYLCTMICLCGVCVNLIHIVVLTRPHMRAYTVNSILSIMAACDVVTMCSYLVYLVRFTFVDNDENVIGYSYFWLVFLLAHVVISIALHTMSLYLSVVMAYIRWTALNRLDSKWIKSRSTRPPYTYGASCSIYQLSQRWWIEQQQQLIARICRLSRICRARTKSIFFVICSSIMTLSIPTLLVHRIIPADTSEFADTNLVESSNRTKEFAPRQVIGLYTVDLDPSVTENSCRVFKLNLWLTGIIFKAIPCLLMLWFTIALMQKLYETGLKRRRLLGLEANSGKTPLCKKKLPIDKTTRLLILMLAIFVCTELPQGALAILNAIYTNDVHTFLYLNLGEVLDLLSLINCNVGFVLYCCMSSRYRAAFRHIFLRAIRQHSSAAALSLHQTVRRLSNRAAKPLRFHHSNNNYSAASQM